AHAARCSAPLRQARGDVRVDRERLVINRERVLWTAAQEAEMAPLGIGLEILGIRRGRLIVVLERFSEIALPLVVVAAIGNGAGVLGIDLYRLLEVGERAVRLIAP